MPLSRSPVKDDCLLRALFECEQKLHEWIHRSAHNAIWFAKDPIGAIRAANLDMDEALLMELESVASGIAVKLK